MNLPFDYALPPGHWFVRYARQPGAIAGLALGSPFGNRDFRKCDRAGKSQSDRRGTTAPAVARELVRHGRPGTRYISNVVHGGVLH